MKKIVDTANHDWRKPQLIKKTFDELAKSIKVRAGSSFTEIPCSGCGSCACQGQCNPVAFYWSCGDFFVGVGR